MDKLCHCHTHRYVLLCLSECGQFEILPPSMLLGSKRFPQVPHLVTIACMQLYELACSYTNLHACSYMSLRQLHELA